MLWNVRLPDRAAQSMAILRGNDGVLPGQMVWLTSGFETVDGLQCRFTAGTIERSSRDPSYQATCTLHFRPCKAEEGVTNAKVCFMRSDMWSGFGRLSDIARTMGLAYSARSGTYISSGTVMVANKPCRRATRLTSTGLFAL